MPRGCLQFVIVVFPDHTHLIFLCLSMVCYALLCAHSSFSIILKRKRKLVVLLLWSYRCNVTINVLWLFLMVPWVGLQSVIVVLPDHTHLLFACWAFYMTWLSSWCLMTASVL